MNHFIWIYTPSYHGTWFGQPSCMVRGILILINYKRKKSKMFSCFFLSYFIFVFMFYLKTSLQCVWKHLVHYRDVSMNFNLSYFHVMVSNQVEFSCIGKSVITIATDKALLMSTHNICFHWEIRKNIMWIPSLICSYHILEMYQNISSLVFAQPDLILYAQCLDSVS